MPRGASPHESLIARANSLYEQGKKKEALKLINGSDDEWARVKFQARIDAGRKSKKLEGKVGKPLQTARNNLAALGVLDKKPTFKEAVTDPSIRKSKNIVKRSQRDSDITMAIRPAPRPKKKK